MSFHTFGYTVLLNILLVGACPGQAQPSAPVVSPTPLAHLDHLLAAGVSDDSLQYYFDANWRAFAQKGVEVEFLNGAIEPLRQAYRQGRTRLVGDWLERMCARTEVLVGSDVPLRATLFYQRARCSYFASQLDRCVELAREGRSVCSQAYAEDPLLLASSYNLEGAALRGLGRSEAAILAYEEALQRRTAELGAKHNLVAAVHNNLGVAYRQLALFDRALQHMEIADAIRSTRYADDPPRELGMVKNNIGILYDDLGAYRKAIHYFEQALRIFRRYDGDNSPEIVSVLTNLGVTHNKLSAFDEAAAFYQQAEVKLKSGNTRNEQAFSKLYLNQSTVALRQGLYGRAAAFAEKALRANLRAHGPEHTDVAAAYLNLGQIYQEKEQYEQAIRNFRQALRIHHRSADYRRSAALVHTNLASVHILQEDWSAARQQTDSAQLLLQQLYPSGRHPLLAFTYYQQADILYRNAEYPAALRRIQRALIANHQTFQAADPRVKPPAMGYLSADYHHTCLLLKARLLHRIGRESQALSDFELAQQHLRTLDTLLLRLHQELYARDDKITLAQRTREYAELSIENAFDLGRLTGGFDFIEEAFYSAERSKAAVLGSFLANNTAKTFSGIPQDVLDREEKLQSSIYYYQRELSQRPDAETEQRFQQALFQARRAHKALIAQLEADYPQYYQMKYQGGIPATNKLREQLEEGTMLLSYFSGDSLLTIFGLDRSGIRVTRQPINRDFYRWQVGLRKSIVLGLDDVYRELGHRLFTYLIPDGIPSDIERLLLVPDGALVKLPFEALLTRPAKQKEAFKELPYLVRDFEVSYAQSSAIHLSDLWQQQQVVSSDSLFAFAPVFEQAYPAYATGRELYARGNRFLPALPATRTEVQAISEIFQQRRAHTALFTDARASEEVLQRRDLLQYGYLHIATHGFVNEADPDRSGLYCFAGTAPGDNGMLEAAEVYGLQLRARLLVLSACETGLGALAAGEGLLGLSWAFTYAGAQNLLVSLWQVDDQATAELMSTFYRQHLRHQDRAFAHPLRRAKLRLIDSGDYSHPYFWAPFVLIGE